MATTAVELITDLVEAMEDYGNFDIKTEDGKFIAIEVKTESGRLRPEQEKFKAFAETQNILYGVARSVEEAIKIVEED